MDYLFTIYRQPDINLSGTILFREAYRAIIMKDDQILLVKSRKFGEVKFPGGGIKPGEDAFQALYREVLEETGYRMKPGIRPLGSTLEYARDFEGIYDVFQQKSTYFFCDIFPEQQALALDDYEIEYGYQPIFIRIQDAIAMNESVTSNDRIPWKERDTLVLQFLWELQNAN